MIRFLLTRSSVLRPDDEALSDDEKEQVQLYRLISLCGALIIPFLSVLYRTSNPEGVSPIRVYLGVSGAWAFVGLAGLYTLLVVGSYISTWVRRHYVPLMWALLYLQMMWITAVATANRFSSEYGLALLLTYASIGVVIELAARSLRPILWFLGFGFFLTAGGLYVASGPQLEPPILLGIMAVVGLTVGFSLQGRLSIRAQRDLLDRLIETSPNAIIRLDQDGAFVQASGRAEDILGFNEADVLGRRYDDLEWSIAAFDEGEDLPEEGIPFRQVLSTGRPIQDVEISIRWPDGTRRFLSVSGAPLGGQDGAVGEAVFHLRDITDRERREQVLRKAKEDAEAASRAKSAFLANMSHEIRTPLTSIIGFAEALSDEVDALDQDPDEADLATLSRFSSLIGRGGNRLLNTLEGVLNLSKFEAGQMELEAHPVNLAKQARQAAEELRPKAKEKGLELRVETDGASPRAEADEGGVQIILRNLLSNAIKYTPDGGTVWVRTYRENGKAVLEVEDTGIGMKPNVVGQIFKPFRQASEGTGREYEGTGVGLAVTQKAVDGMNGHLLLETEDGQGSRFTVQLPMAPTRTPTSDE